MTLSSPDDRVVECDFLILGSGLAGLDLALHLAEMGSVIILTKSQLEESNSLYAQGGIAAVLDPLHDRSEDHVTDTLTAGAGLCHQDTVQFVVENGPQAIQRLIDLGVIFTKDENGYHLTREGGHSARRVIHAADATGKAVVETMLELVQANPNIKLYPYHMGVDLITCHKMGHVIKDNRVHGCYALDTRTNVVRTFQAKFTILATGGAGKVYLYTSNPDVATGDGIAMAYRAGCKVANMEFIQFHPTCLYHPLAKSFLISEAVRGEGGILRLKSGEAFMARHHPLKELAPRDIVARAIDGEMKRTGHDCVFLDITNKSADFIKEHFPTIYGKCLSLGIDITREPIPVVPAAHYTCGGVMTDLNGKTSMDCLYAIGEASHTGLHGANRLASNSLLECLVFAKATAEHIRHRLANNPPVPPPRIPVWDSFDTGPYEEAVLIAHNWDEIRRSMWNYVGIVRSNHRLARAHRRIELLQKEINEYYWGCQITQDLLELRNIALVAALIIRSAMHRKESRGLHYTIDHPDKDDALWLKDTILPIT